MQIRNSLTLTLLMIIGLLFGCTSVPFNAPKPASYAFADHVTAETFLGRQITPMAAAHPNQSGFYLLSDGIEALAARLLLSQRAERSIDAQYYLLLNDITGQLFMAALLQAADRGVRVRLLLDDTYTAGYDTGIAALNSHPNFEIRLFNPFSRSRGRLLSGVTEFSRINRRMHNKSMTFDNQITIVGGRNIGAEYFEAKTGSNYNDLDVLGIGPVAQDVSASFDTYWNDPLAVPANVLVKDEQAQSNLDQRRKSIPGLLEQARKTKYGAALESAILKSIRNNDINLSWNAATVVADPPEKAQADYSGDHPQQLSSVMGPVIRAAEKELIVVSAYFVPGKNGVDLFRSLTERGVRVIIVTNSLAANDVVPVHAGYAPYRKDLLEAGVELWEVRAEAKREGRQKRGLGQSLSSLHTKAFTIDRSHLFIGSFNWDPRSVNINTEMGVYINAPELTATVLREFERLLPLKAYRLRLNQNDEIEWSGREDGQEVVYHRDPKASFWRRFSAGFYSLFPLESQL